MQTTFPLLFAVLLGFAHAFEADHLLAVSNIVIRRNRLLHAMKDGMIWGLGHTSTLFIIGFLMLVVKVSISEHTFHFFEASVGLMLMGLGVYRLIRSLRHRNTGGHGHTHTEDGKHHLAYGIGMVHGLAGSGALVVLVMSQLPTIESGLGYLLLFGLGSAAGMLVASGVFSLPFSQKHLGNYALQFAFTLLSSALCVGFGAKMVYENLLA